MFGEITKNNIDNVLAFLPLFTENQENFSEIKYEIQTEPLSLDPYRLFEKWLAVILIEFLPPLIPPYKGGKQENLVPSRHLRDCRQSRPTQWLPFIRGGLGWGNSRTGSDSITCVYTVAFIRGGLGWGKKIFDTSIMTFQTSSHPERRNE